MAFTYENYCLKQNPFPRTGSFPLNSEHEREYAMALSGRSSIKTKIKEKLSLLRDGEMSVFIFIVGNQGLGKTHILKYVEYFVNENFHNLMPIYVKNLGKAEMLEFYKRIIEAIEMNYGREFFITLAKDARKLQSNLMNDIFKPFPEFKTILPALAGSDITALRWLYGEKLDSDEREKLRIIKEINNFNASSALVTLIKWIYYVRKWKPVILVDELESILFEEKEKLREFYERLRDLIDQTSKEAFFMFACMQTLMEGTKGISFLHPALYSRIKGDIVYLKPLSKSEVEELVRNYLKIFRTSSGRKYISNPLFPFTKDAIKEIHEQTRGYPRDVLSLASKCLTNGVEKRKKNIDAEFVRAVLKKEKIPVEIKVPTPEILMEPTEISTSQIFGTSQTRKALRVEVKKQRKLKVPATKDEKTIEDMILKLLEETPKRSERFSVITRKLKLKKELAKEILSHLEKKKKVKVKRIGGGYRVYLT